MVTPARGTTRSHELPRITILTAIQGCVEKSEIIDRALVAAAQLRAAAARPPPSPAAPAGGDLFDPARTARLRKVPRLPCNGMEWC